MKNVMSINDSDLTIVKNIEYHTTDSYAYLNYLIDTTIEETIRFLNEDAIPHGEVERFVFKKSTLDYIISRLVPENKKRLIIKPFTEKDGEVWCWALSLKRKPRFN